MNKNKYILNYCPNFHKIINFDYEKEDILTMKMINIYRSYIFNINVKNKNNFKKINYLDKIVYNYLKDYKLRIEIKKKFSLIEFVTTSNITESLVKELINIYEKYLNETARNIYIAKWI